MTAEQLAALANKAAETNDFTKESSGGNYEKTLPVAGKALCRLREYVELGMQPTASAAYPNKKPARKARFVFELVTPKHIETINEGEDNEFKRAHTIRIDVVISNSPKSNFFKLFRQLNYAQKATHPAQLLNAGWLCEVVHAWKKGDDPKKDKPSYANLQKDGVYTFEAPRMEDPTTCSVTDLPVASLLGGSESLRLFLFDNPTKETWDSLFIEGTYTKTVDGVEKEFSKNFVQNTIMEALDYPGSEVEALVLSGDGTGLGDLPTEQPAEQAAPTPTDADDPLAGLV